MVVGSFKNETTHFFFQNPYLLTWSRNSDELLAGQPGFDSRQGQDNFLFSTTSRPAVVFTQPLIQ
jgi:hypothetical protein